MPDDEEEEEPPQKEIIVVAREDTMPDGSDCIINYRGPCSMCRAPCGWRHAPPRPMDIVCVECYRGILNAPGTEVESHVTRATAHDLLPNTPYEVADKLLTKWMDTHLKRKEN